MRTAHSYLLCLLLIGVAIQTSTADDTPNSVERKSGIVVPIYRRVFDSIVTHSLETPIQIRCLFYFQMAVWNAWVNYHPTAVDFFGRTRFKRPSSEHTLQNKNIAIIYSIFRMHQRSPNTCGGDSTLPEFRTLFIELNLDPDDTSLNMSSPVGIGNRAGWDTAKLIQVDGWNADGQLTGSQNNYKLPFQDHTGYTPVNDPWMLKYPFRWQPVLETNKHGYFSRQEFVTPQAASAMMFTMTPDQAHKKRVKPLYNNRNAKAGYEDPRDILSLKKYAIDVFNTSRKLNVRRRLLAELFDNKIRSFPTEENPIGVSSIAAAFRVSMFPQALDWGIDDDIVYGMSANMVTMESTLLTWREKVRHDNVRPTGQTMAYLFGKDRKFRVWGGPSSSPVSIRASEWQPYIRTMPHSEYPSGSACLCSALVEEALKTTGGKNDIPFSTTVLKGSSKFYPGKIPERDTTINIRTVSEWGELCVKSRLWAGVHFRPALGAGRRLCKGVGSKTHDIVQDMLAGKQSSPWQAWLPEGQEKFWES